MFYKSNILPNIILYILYPTNPPITVTKITIIFKYISKQIKDKIIFL